MFSLEEIKEALINGNKVGFQLFQEAHKKNIIEDLEKLPEIKKMIGEMEVYTDSIFEEASPKITFKMIREFEKTGNRLIFENAYFKSRKQLFSIIITYILKGDKKYIPAIEERLWEWCDFYSWELPAHFSYNLSNGDKERKEPDKIVALFAAETAFFFAEILSIIGGNLDTFLVTRLKKEIFRRVINPFEINSYPWETLKMNWSSVCAGSVGAAAIYLIEDTEELALILERALKSMDSFISAFDKDGLITEGLGYWNYGFSFYIYFSELLRERTIGKISLLQESDKIKKIAELPKILQFPSGEFVNFSDSGCGKWWGDCGLFSKLENTLNIKGYNYTNSTDVYSDHTFRWAIMVRKLLWSKLSDKNGLSHINQGSFYFTESQWLVDRRVINGEFIAFAAKGGNNEEPHNHNDLGHFILHYMGEDVFIDIGSPEYLKEYFKDETRYNFLAASSLGHSVPIINNNSQSYGEQYFAEVLKYEAVDSKTYLKLNLKNAYVCKEVSAYEREFIWNYESLELEIKDMFKFHKRNNEIKEVFITKVRPELIEGNKIIIKNKKFNVELLFSNTFRCIIEKCEYNNHSGEKSFIYQTVFAEKVDSEKEYSFKIKICR